MLNRNVWSKLTSYSKKELTNAKRLEHFFDRIADGFIGLDGNARVAYWNKAAETLSLILRNLALGEVLWDMNDVG